MLIFRKSNRLAKTKQLPWHLWLLFQCCATAWLAIAYQLSWADSTPPFVLPNQSELLKIKSAIITTSEGKIYLELFPETAPWHVANFKYRADKGLYRNSTFDIYYPGYIIQGGKPAKGSNPPADYSLPPEFSSRQHIPGTLGMARASDENNAKRRSSGSQFHLIVSDSPHMDGNYTIFGQVKKGLDVVENLRRGSVIRDIKVFIRKED